MLRQYIDGQSKNKNCVSIFRRSACSTRKAQLESAMKNGDFDQTLSEILKTDFTVLAVGEVHETYLDQDLAVFVDRIKEKDSKVDCLVLEYRQADIDEIDQFFKDPAKVCLSDDVYNRLPILRVARRRGLKLIAGEHDRKNAAAGVLFSMAPEWLNNRDEALAQHIEDMTKKGICHKSIVIYGAAHITDAEYLKSQRTNLVEILRAKKVKVTTVQAVVTGPVITTSGREYKDPRWMKRICEPSNPAPANQNFGFRPSFPIDIDSEERGSWSEVDFIIGFKHRDKYKPSINGCNRP